LPRAARRVIIRWQCPEAHNRASDRPSTVPDRRQFATPSSTAWTTVLAAVRWAKRPSATHRRDLLLSAAPMPMTATVLRSLVPQNRQTRRADGVQRRSQTRRYAGASPTEQRPFAGAVTAALHCLVAVAQAGSSRPE
jgi:hypothetical protein